jgi:hypothetical protein
MWISEIEIPMGVEVFLKTGTHQDFGSVFEYVDRTVAVVDIKIDDSNTTDTFVRKRQFRGKSNVVEQTKPHSRRDFCVMSWWPDGAKDASRVPA